MSKLTFKQFIISESDKFTELQHSYLKSENSEGETNELNSVGTPKKDKKKSKKKNYDPKLFNPQKWNQYLQWASSVAN